MVVVPESDDLINLAAIRSLLIMEEIDLLVLGTGLLIIVRGKDHEVVEVSVSH